MKPLHFLDEPITPRFDKTPTLEKKQGCPDSFTWRETEYRIVEMISEWHDYSRKGRMARNMQSQHAEVASHRGSRGGWGVIISLSGSREKDFSNCITIGHLWTHFIAREAGLSGVK